MSESDINIVKEIPEEKRLHRKEVELLEKILKKVGKNLPEEEENIVK